MNSNTLPEERLDPLHETGGEPLDGSGFEAEEPDDRFGPNVPEAEVA